MAIVTTGNLRGPILSVLRAACAPVKIPEVLGRYHPDLHPRARDTMRDLSDLGMVHLSATHATALRGNGNPYRSTERRERVAGLALVEARPEYTVPMPTHAPVTRAAPVVTAPKPKPKPKPATKTGLSKVDAQRAIGRQYRASIWPRVEELRAEGLSIRKIHKELGIAEPTITKAIKERVEAGWTGPCGDKFVPVPISEHDKTLARKMRIGGASMRAICKALGRDHKTVLRALLNKV
jgi:hypothetical protein